MSFRGSFRQDVLPSAISRIGPISCASVSSRKPPAFQKIENFISLCLQVLWLVSASHRWTRNILFKWALLPQYCTNFRSTSAYRPNMLRKTLKLSGDWPTGLIPYFESHAPVLMKIGLSFLSARAIACQSFKLPHPTKFFRSGHLLPTFHFVDFRFGKLASQIA